MKSYSTSTLFLLVPFLLMHSLALVRAFTSSTTRHTQLQQYQLYQQYRHYCSSASLYQRQSRSQSQSQAWKILSNLQLPLFGTNSNTNANTGTDMKEEVDPGVVEGTNLRIVKYPHPALRAPNAEITEEELKGTEIADLAKGMFKVMYAAEGVGLAAPQVGVNKRLMVYNPSGDAQKWLEETVLVNPKIVEYSDAKDTAIEGCLSFPDMSGEVMRSKWIKVQATNLKGKTIKKKFTGWEARIFQHEYDHLDGTVYIDRLTPETKLQLQPRLQQLIQEFGPGGQL